MRLHGPILAFLLSGAASLAHAAPPVAQFFCASGGNFISSESQVVFNPPTFKFNLSYFDLTVANSSDPNSDSGGSSGKTTSQALALHAALAKFVDLSNVASAGGTFSECTLETSAPGGDVLLFTLKSVKFQSVSAIASSVTQSAFTAATLNYASVAIRVMQSGADNGGTTVPPN